MKRTVALFLISLFSLSISAQNKHESFIQKLNWLNENPVPSGNKQLIFTSADLIRFQLEQFPDFYANFDFLKALNPLIKGHRYERYFEVIYTYNQLAYRLQNKEQSNRLHSTLYSIRKLLESYEEIVGQEPKLRIETLDRYSKMSKADLKTELKNYI